MKKLIDVLCILIAANVSAFAYKNNQWLLFGLGIIAVVIWLDNLRLAFVEDKLLKRLDELEGFEK